MVQFHRTVVHILGCHMQAERSNGDGWERINWAGGTPQGRIAHGMRIATMHRANNISFGTGASMSGGIKEAARMRGRAQVGIQQMGDDSTLSHSDVDRLDALMSALHVRVDAVTQNTTEEIQAVFDWVIEKYPGECVHIIFVTSAFHAARAANEAARIAHKLFGMGPGTKIQYSISPAYDDPGETFVLEESHRGDMPKINWLPLKRLFGLFGKPKELQSIIDHAGEMAARAKEGPSD